MYTQLLGAGKIFATGELIAAVMLGRLVSGSLDDSALSFPATF